VLEHEGFRLGVAAVTDHPAAFAARPGVPGVAFAPAEVPNPGWLMGSLEAVGGRADAVLLSRHWGPNYAPRPIARVRAAAEVSRAHATVVAGHSAHVFHGVEQNVLYDLGDFVHHYGRDIFPSRSLARRLGHVLEDLGKIPGEAREASLTRSESRSSFVRLQRDRVDRLLRRTRVRRLRPDHGLLFLLEIDGRGLRRLEAVPLRLGPRRTVLAGSRDGAWTLRRFGAACRALGTHVRFEGGRAVITWS
jgi:poly-gamma-glutamate synthesis protein (capsule biosynthesis protein)